MNKVSGNKISLITLCVTAMFSTFSQAGIMVYPAHGQSNDQLSKDRFECHSWAVQQSGFDPSNAQAAQANPQPQQNGEVLRGGARGALGGAAIGAIAGNAGKGAAIGATAGGLRKGFQKIDNNRNAQNQPAASAPGQDAYNRAISACLTGRGYTVN